MADEPKQEEVKEEAKKEASPKVVKIVEEVAGLSVLELSELVNALQDKLGVTAIPQVAANAAPTGQAPAPDADSAGGGAATQTVVMTAAGDNKIAVIKAIKEINTALGLQEAKAMTETLPAEILKDAKAEEAKVAADKLKAAGATVELK